MENNDQLARHTGQPDVPELVTMGKPMGNGFPVSGVAMRPELVKEFRRSMNEGYTLERTSSADKARYMRWTGQSDDGKKHDENLPEGKPAFPWDGASDTRVPMVDSIINDCVDMLSMSASRAQLGVTGTELSDLEPAGAATTLMNWVKNSMHNTLGAESELLAQYMMAYGWTAAFVGWEQKSALKTQELRSVQPARWLRVCVRRVVRSSQCRTCVRTRQRWWH